MKKAVDRIKKAKELDETVMIFWDYDVDWVTSTSILMHFFKKIWLKVSYRLPHRIHDWYWLKSYFIDELKDLWVSLIITVDCWTKDVEVVKYAKTFWIDTIITDHHAVPDIIPDEAVALINPKRKDCDYPFKWLAWAWVAYKLMMALAREYLSEEEYRAYLLESIDICAIWTVADCMTLTGENRIIVVEWLKQLKKSRSKWIRKLIEDKIHEDLDGDIFWFTIWPRLNAAGRMDSPYKAVNLILNNSDWVYDTISEIEVLNEKRKALTKDFVEEALKNVNRNDNIIFYDSDKIEHGIIWIVAWRLTEQFYRPSIVLKDEWDKLVASCRSPEYFSIVEILDRYRDSFLTFWWHKQAAWFSISKSKFGAFKEAILKEVNEIDFSSYKKQIIIDKVVSLDELGFGFLNKINRYKPYGIGNLKPLFIVRDLDYTKLSFLWQWRDHIKFDTKHGFKIFWFFMWGHYENIKNASSIDLVFDLSEDSWMWKKNLMLKIVDLVVN
jgi:single-stranded-DNA-specific exonuclease